MPRRDNDGESYKVMVARLRERVQADPALYETLSRWRDTLDDPASSSGGPPSSGGRDGFEDQRGSGGAGNGLL